MVNHKSSETSSSREIYTLSFLRGIASLYVVIAHVMIWGGYKGYFPNPKVAVDVFIFISGFLIFGGLLSKRKSLSVYFKHRFFRIAPCYYFSILVFASLYPFIKEGLVYIQSLDRLRWPLGSIYDASLIVYDLKNILLHVSFIFGLFPKYSQSSYMGDWSIGLEMQFYLIAPLLVLFFSKRRFVSVIVFIGLFTCFFSNRNSFALSFVEPSLIIIKLHIFILGGLVFLAIKEVGVYKKCLILFSLLIIFAQFRIHRHDFISNNSATYLLISVVLVLNYRFFNSLFDNFIVRFFSQISYPLYLIHGVFIALSGLVYMNVDHDIPLLYIMALVTIPLSIVFAWFISETIERKGIEMAKKKFPKINVSE